MDHLEHTGFYAVLEGAGWGAMIGTLAMGFHLLASAVRNSDRKVSR
jgi:hypothetical protein